MRKLLNKPWFVAFLVIAAVAAIWSSVPSSPSSSRVAVYPEPLSEGLLADAGGERMSPQEAVKKLPVVKAARDPFAVNQPAPAAPATPEVVPVEPDIIDSAHLTALWTQNGKTLMVINNRIYSVGESIGRVKIESASAYCVCLSYPQGEAFLELGKTFVLRTPAHPVPKSTNPILP